LPAMEIISTRKVGKRVSPSRVFTEYIGNENGTGLRVEIEQEWLRGSEWGREWLHWWYRTGLRVELEWLMALQVVIASHMGITS
jgi:hypothetical protein